MNEQPQTAEMATATDDAFWALYERALPTVFGYLARRTTREVAEDLTQEVFLTAARTWVSSSVTVTDPWLVTVAKSRLIDHFRSEGRRRRNLVLAWSSRPGDPGDQVGASFDASHFTATTERALAQLPTTQRTALVLHHLDDLSVADVAEVLDKSVRATESLLARARRAFRAALEEGR